MVPPLIAVLPIVNVPVLAGLTQLVTPEPLVCNTWPPVPAVVGKVRVQAALAELLLCTVVATADPVFASTSEPKTLPCTPMVSAAALTVKFALPETALLLVEYQASCPPVPELTVPLAAGATQLAVVPLEVRT